ncbi:HlyD family efflux transporter periplasmic adaptor subunit [bacterium]|nr:HlyD family efflux transporter periplasmic adaptor subunit [bacterium]
MSEYQSETTPDPRLVDQTRREIGRLVSEIEQLANSDIPPNEFYAECMRRVYTALAARAVALWTKTPQGNLQLQFQVNLPQLGLDEQMRPAHDELLRHVVTKQEATIVAPYSGSGMAGAEIVAQGIQNPTPFLLVLAPILIDGETSGLIEVFQEASRKSNAQQGYVQFLKRIAGEVARFVKNGRYRIILTQQSQWNQIEAFIRTIHGGLNPTQVAYLVVNEGKRLLQCERLTVAIRRGKKTRVVAISGQDVVEQRSNLVRRLTQLTDRVVAHGENLVYSGKIESHWPGDVKKALETYVAESGSKLIIIVPMKDSREFANPKGKANTAVICEMVEDPAPPEEMAAKVDVITRHASVALANALEHDEVFLLPVWKFLGRSTRWIRGRGLPKILLALVAIGAVATFLVLFPYPLRLEGRGELVPDVRRVVYAPVQGVISEVKVKHGDQTEEGSILARISSIELDRQQIELAGQIQEKEQQRAAYEAQRNESGKLDPELDGKIALAKQELEAFRTQERLLDVERKKLDLRSPIRGTIMDWKPQEKLLNRPVEKGDPLLEIADVDGKWIVEVNLPENTITHITEAETKFHDKLDVEFVLSAAPDIVYKGRLIEHATQAHPVEQENFIEAKIEIDPDQNLVNRLKEAAEKSGEGTSMVSGIEVRAKVNCGDHPLGYVLFRELIDFVREYVFF